MGLFDPDISAEPVLTSGQLGLLDNLTFLLSEQLGQGVDPYHGTVVPGATSAQKGVYDWAAGGGIGFDQTGALRAALDPRAATDQSPERYVGGFDESYGGALEDYWNKYTRRGLEHELGSSGMSGGMADALAGSYATNVAVPAAEARWGAHMTGLGAEQDAAETALARALGASGAVDASMAGRLAAGESERAISGEALGEDYEKWLSSQSYMNPWTSQYLGSALGTQSFQNFAGPSIWSQIGLPKGTSGAATAA
jgi:hypothetical protein